MIFHDMQGDLRYSNWTKPPSSYQPRWDSWGRFVEPLASNVCPFPDFTSHNGALFLCVYNVWSCRTEYEQLLLGPLLRHRHPALQPLASQSR